MTPATATSDNTLSHAAFERVIAQIPRLSSYPLYTDFPSAQQAGHRFALQHDGERLALFMLEPIERLSTTKHTSGQNPSHAQKTKKKSTTSLSPLSIDFDSLALHYRRDACNKKQELIVRAVCVKKTTTGGDNTKPHTPPTTALVLDLTAGLGTDAFILACAGCQVLMLERSPIIAALLADGLIRARAHPALHTIANRLQLVATDAQSWMQQWLQQDDRAQIDTVYYDPMFPDSKKTAQVKKNAQWLRLITEAEEEGILQDNSPHKTHASRNTIETDALLQLGCQVARKRVVVKRPRTANTLGNQSPNWVIMGSSNRFDVYDAQHASTYLLNHS